MLFALFFVTLLLSSSCITAKSIISINNHLLTKTQSNNENNKYKTSDSVRKILGIYGGSSSEELTKIDWRYFLAGGLCAATSHGITTPIDVVKTRMQQDPEKYNSGVINAARKIVSEEGIGFLLAGLGPTVVGYGLEGAMKFGFYETFKSVFSDLTPFKTINLLLASIIAGAVASIILVPMEETRIKMVGDASWSKENLVTGIVRLMKETGIINTFAGLPAMLSKQVPYTMGKQVSFDLFAAIFYTMLAQTTISKADAKWGISLLSAFFASILACISSQPGDMILTATYQSTTGTNFFNIVGNIYKSRGLGGFYVGLQARLAHVASIITSQLVLYDIIKIALGLPVTGSH